MCGSCVPALAGRELLAVQTIPILPITPMGGLLTPMGGLLMLTSCVWLLRALAECELLAVQTTNPSHHPDGRLTPMGDLLLM